MSLKIFLAENNATCAVSIPIGWKKSKSIQMLTSSMKLSSLDGAKMEVQWNEH